MRLVHPPTDEDGNEEDIDYYEDVEEAEPMEMLEMDGQEYASGYEDDETNYLDEDEDSNLANISY